MKKSLYEGLDSKGIRAKKIIAFFSLLSKLVVLVILIYIFFIKK